MATTDEVGMLTTLERQADIASEGASVVVSLRVWGGRDGLPSYVPLQTSSFTSN